MRYPIILTILALTLFSASSFGQTEYAIEWNAVKNAELNGAILSKELGSKGIGLAYSNQILFGKGQANVHSGYFTYTYANNSGNRKSIGYAPINDPDIGSGQIVYGFSFGKNNKIRLFSPQGKVTVPYNSGTSVKLERVEDLLKYYVDGVEKYSVVVSLKEDLQIRAKLTSENAVFADVECSYQTTPFCVNPTIDNINKRIDLQITGGFPPYKYVWERIGDPECKTSCTYETFVEGPNYVTIFDAQGNKTSRMYSLGTDVVWDDFYQSEAIGSELSNNSSGNKWGSARLGSPFTYNSTSWVEYVIEKENGGKKAFGFADASLSIRRVHDLMSGFLISKDNLQIIDNGDVVLTLDYLDKDALNILYKSGAAVWYVNGKEVYSSKYAQSGDITIVGLVRKQGTLDKVNYSTNYPAIVIPSWDISAETGKVDVDINSIAGVTGPFHYFISEDPIPHLKETYKVLTNDLGLSITEAEFYQGNETSKTYSFDNLESGTYYVTVFDSEGNRLFSREVQVQGDFSFENQSNLVASGETISAPVEDGVGSLELYTHEGLNTELSFVRRRANSEMFVGFASPSTNVSGYANLRHGFYIDNRRLFTIENGVLSTEFVILRRLEEFSMKVEDGKLNLIASGETLSSISLPSEYEYKVGVGIAQGNELRIRVRLIRGPLRRFRVIATADQHTSCNGSNGTLSVKVNPFGLLNGSTSNYSITEQSSGQQIASGVLNDNVAVAISTDVNGNPLNPGVYLLSGFVNGPLQSFPFSREIYLGVEAQLSDVSKYDVTPNSYSVSRTNVDPASWAVAKSDNFIFDSEDGWIEFQPKMSSSVADSPIPLNVLTLKDYNLVQDVFSGANLPILAFYPNSLDATNPLGYTMVFAPGSGVFVTSVNDEARIRIGLSGSNIEIYVNGTLKHTATRPAGMRHLLMNSANEELGFKNIVTSFSCSRGCPPISQYPNPETEFPIDKVYNQDGSLSEICPGETREFSVAGLANFARWETTTGSLSCTDCLTTTFTSDGTNATVTVYLFEDPAVYGTGVNEEACFSYTFDVIVGECPVDPCQIGDVVTSNGTNPVHYSPCDVPQITLNPGLFYSWSPQIGLSCYDCNDPTFLLTSIQNDDIPTAYTVKAYHTALDRTLGKHCSEITINTLKKYCAKDCNFNVTIQPDNLTGLCVGDVVVLDAYGEGSFVWDATSGLNCTNCSTPFFTVQSEPVLVSMDVFNAQGELCGEYEVEIGPAENCLHVDGISYNNYGVNTYVYVGTSTEETHLNIYGSVLNEVVDVGGQLDLGTFINESFIAVTKDWINNGLNDFFETSLSFGTERLIGSYQRIRGISPTKYYDLELNGQGKKEMFVDAYALNSMDLTLNELSTRDNVMYVVNNDPTIITRTDGFVSSNLPGGGLSREMLLGSGDYIYPLGSSLGTIRYRPIEISPDINNATKSRLVNYDPAYDNLIELAADVQSVNTFFYHEIEPNLVNNSTITFHYNEVLDGDYQHIAQYETQDPLDMFWQKTGPIVLGTSTQTPNTSFVQTTWDDFGGTPYALANAGFVIDWSDFGDDGSTTGGGGDDVTVTVTSPGGGSTGGGLGDPSTVGDDPLDPDDGSGLFTPSPVAGTYTITVDGGACVESGEIIFDVDGAGNIVDESIFFNKGGVQLPLAESLYSLESAVPGGPTSILDINSTPESSFAECTDDVKIVLSDRLTLNVGDDFTVDAPIDFTVLSIDIFDASGASVGTSASAIWNSTGVPDGLHHYEVKLDNGGTIITLKGQFIII